MSPQPLRVLHVVPTFYPALRWGGPIISLHELCNHLAELPQVEIRVLTTDSSGPGSGDRLAAEAISPEQFPGYEVMFCRKSAGRDFSVPLLQRLRSSIAWADVIHLTGVYSSPTLPTLGLARATGKPVVWSPRGALQRWSGSRRIVGKWMWDRACTLLANRARTVLHVTAAEEERESTARLAGMRAVIIPNGVRMPDDLPARSWRPRAVTRLAYLGRLDPKKGIENLLRATAMLPGCSLSIYGSGDPAYVQQLMDETRALNLRDRVSFRGAVARTEKERALVEADLLVVPSHTENFAMVVAEGLAHGTPVVASTGTPWKEIEARKVGRWVDNDPATLARAIRSLEHEDLQDMGRRGREWMRAEYDWRRVAERMAAVYRSLVPDAKLRSSDDARSIGLGSEGQR